jgi:DNA-directed RNA polymerase specialized sigma24 family protein
MTTREIPPDVADNARRARELRVAAASMLEEASRLTRPAVRQLLGSGWKQTAIADILGLSDQRVSQLVKDLKKATPNS